MISHETVCVVPDGLVVRFSYLRRTKLGLAFVKHFTDVGVTHIALNTPTSTHLNLRGTVTDALLLYNSWLVIFGVGCFTNLLVDLLHHHCGTSENKGISDTFLGQDVKVSGVFNCLGRGVSGTTEIVGVNVPESPNAGSGHKGNSSRLPKRGAGSLTTCLQGWGFPTDPW
jgi:hypothetical protein